MKRKMLIGFVTSIFLTVCVSSQAQEDDSRECAKNFSEKGFKNYRTTVTIKSVSKKLAMKRLVRALSRDGYSVTKSDSENGIISATFDAGKADLQFSGFIDQSGSNSEVELNLKASGDGLAMLFVKESAYRNDMCMFSEAMQSK